MPRSRFAVGLRPIEARAIVQTAVGQGAFVFPDGDATLSIEMTGEEPVSPRTQLFFECDALDETVAALKTKGIEFTQEPTDMSYLWREARLREPDGHDVRLYQATENRLNPPWRMKDVAPPGG